VLVSRVQRQTVNRLTGEVDTDLQPEANIRMKSNLFLLVLTLTSIRPWHIGIAQDPDDCLEKLRDVLQEEDVKERLEGLNDLLGDCPRHVATLVGTAKLYTELRDTADVNWPRIALGYYQRGVESDSVSVEAHLGLASTAEYLGLYELAVPHYDWLSRNVNDQRKLSEARVHLITCRFLAANRKEKRTGSERISVDALDVSDESIKVRSEWSFLKELVVSVAVAGGVTTLEGDGKHLQVALGLLYDWIDAPKGTEIQTRNRFLAGMVSTIAAIVAEKKLGIKLGAAAVTGNSPQVQDLPSESFAGEAEQEFRAKQPDEGRKFKIADDLTIVEQWDVPDISGEWRWSSNGTTFYCGKPSTTSTMGGARIKQNGKILTLEGWNDEYPDQSSSWVGTVRGLNVSLSANSSQGVCRTVASMTLKIDNGSKKILGKGDAVTDCPGVARGGCGHASAQFQTTFWRR